VASAMAQKSFLKKSGAEDGGRQHENFEVLYPVFF
jgi:hypothetical protein